MVNQLNFWFANEDARNVKDGLQIFSQVWFKNVLNQWDCRILKSAISQQKTDKLT